MTDEITIKLFNRSADSKRKRAKEIVIPLTAQKQEESETAQDDDTSLTMEAQDCPAPAKEEVPSEIKLDALDEGGLYTVEIDPEVREKIRKIYVLPDDDAEDCEEREKWVCICDMSDKNDEEYLQRNAFRRDDGFIFAQLAKGMHRESNSNKSVPIRIRIECDAQIFLSPVLDLNLYSGTSVHEMLQMVRIVYEEQPLLLISVFQKSPLSVFLDENSNIRNSIDAKIALMRTCSEVYHKKFVDIKKKKKYKLKEHQYVDRIDKMTSLNAQTLKFMARNPQYLVEVKRERGIRYRGNVYLPEKTLVSKNVINYDIYENRYLVTFLNMMIDECNRLSMQVKLLKEFIKRERDKSGTLKSKQDNLDVLILKCEGQENKIGQVEKSFRQLFDMYKAAFEFEHLKNIERRVEKPRLSAIFRQLPEYNVFYSEAFIPWFEFGEIPMFQEEKEQNFITAVSNPNTTYELYITARWIQYFAENGYEFKPGTAKYAGISEEKHRYSENTYSFPFVKNKGTDEEEEIELFYSPSVYLPREIGTGEEWDVQRKGDVNGENVDDRLYRNTPYSRVVNYEEGESNNGLGRHYEPDFIVKYTKKVKNEEDQIGYRIRYLIADAKHMEYVEVRKKEMPDLVEKYLKSLSVFNVDGPDVKIAGICAVYHKYSDRDENAHIPDIRGQSGNQSEYFEYSMKGLSAEKVPFTRFLHMNVEDEEDEEEQNPEAVNWKDDFEDMMNYLKNY